MRDTNGIFNYGKVMLTGDSIDGHSLGYTPTPYDMILRQVQNHLKNDNEGKVHSALIELGWTPPQTQRKPAPVKGQALNKR